MAYYPLKVKDAGGAVHTVGDPRVAGKANTNSPVLTGTPAAPTAAPDTNSTQIATTGFVISQASAVAPAPDGVVAVGSSLRYARADHVHPIASDGVMHQNRQLVTADISISSGSAGVSVGPMRIDSGVTVTVPVGSAWLIL